MIKFFRKIRIKLIEQSKIRNYSFYAIGEIFLVVIGILIALQINNWNENRKNEIKINTLFKTVLKDLETDVKKINYILNLISDKDSVANSILNNDKELENNALNKNFISFPSVFYQSNNGYTTLMENVDNIPEKYIDLTNNLHPLYGILSQQLKDNLKSIYDLIIEIEQHYAFNMPWYSDELQKKSNPEASDHYNTNSVYKNLVALYQKRINNYELELSILKQATILNYADIHEKTSNEMPLPSFIPKHVTPISEADLIEIAGCYKGESGNVIMIEKMNNFLLFGDNVSSYSILTSNNERNFELIISSDEKVVFKFKKNTSGNVDHVEITSILKEGTFNVIFNKIEDCE